jgi:catecholate siderophore receptor
MRSLNFLSITLILSLAASSLLAAEEHSLSGMVFDPSGQAVAGARVVLHVRSQGDRETRADSIGKFTFERVPAGAASVEVSAGNFKPVTMRLDAARSDLSVVLDTATVSEVITVHGMRPIPTRSSTATKTDTPLRDVPQAVTVISREVMAQQTMRSIGDVVRYVPGIGIAQGEGNRDTPVFRGNSSTSDFYVDGVRDDVQYFRDIYNVERVEALKGPNAMVFGRGGVGGVLNRVTRQADWKPMSEVTLQGGMLQGDSATERRLTGDFDQVLTDNIAARVTGMYENSGSFRDGVHLERQGINPTFAFAIGPNTMLRAGYEYFHDERTADRGITSFAGRPVETDPSTFFGNADDSNARATVNTLSTSLDHTFNDRVTLRSRLFYGDYDKFYQNVFPGLVDTSGTNVNISAYNNATQRRNLFSQTDLVMSKQTGSIAHTILAGVEVGRQVTDNFRNTGFFTSVGANTASVLVPLSDPTTHLPVTFRQGATDADNHGIARVASVYVQDQATLSRHLQLIAGLRYDNFRVDFLNHRTDTRFNSNDGMVSPRLGLVYKPVDPVSLYASYSLSYQPRAGEQLSSLTLSNASLEPETFRNYEVGVKWEIARVMELSAAAYRLNRGNVAVPDPVNPSVTTLVDGQRTEGVEFSASGNVSRVWSVIGAYAYQDGEITRSISATALAGARLAQLPRHSFSLWNKYDVSSAWGFGAGVIHRGEIFTSTDNTVTLPGFTRVDAAIFYTLNDRLHAQLNVENLFDTKYYATANSNTNISPGSPRAIRLSWTTRF